MDGIEKLQLKTQVREKFVYSEVNLLIQHICHLFHRKAIPFTKIVYFKAKVNNLKEKSKHKILGKLIQLI